MASVFVPGVLSGKRVLITGGGTGIGRVLALEYAAHGAKVAIVARREAPLVGVVAAIKAKGGEACWMTMDVRDEARAEEVVTALWERWGRLDMLVNNAGGNFLSPAAAMSTSGFRAVVEINLLGTFTMSRLVGARMIEDGQGGRILNMSATNASHGSPMMAHSGASKAGINSLTQTLALEWGGAGVRVNAILPGPVRTEGSDERLWTDKEGVEKMERRIPLGRFARPEDIVPLAVFLASEAGSFLTGALIVVDGGDSLRTTFLGGE